MKHHPRRHAKLHKLRRRLDVHHLTVKILYNNKKKTSVVLLVISCKIGRKCMPRMQHFIFFSFGYNNMDKKYA